MDPARIALPSRFDVPPARWETMQAAQAPPVEARDAATVILVRDRPGGGFEVFLQHRVAEMAFAGGHTVFPGGSCSPGDRRPCPRTGPTAAQWARCWPGDADVAAHEVQDTALAVLSAAVRETFEECGVLLAGPGTGRLARPADHVADRAALAGGTVDLVDVLTASDLVRRDDLLAPWTRWVTPEGLPKRYDTRFLIAVQPPDQEADARTSEAVDAAWSTPADAIAAFERGDRALLPVTWAVLCDLGRHADTDALLAEARSRRPRPVAPRFVAEDDRVRLTVPAHAGTFLAEDPA